MNCPHDYENDDCTNCANGLPPFHCLKDDEEKAKEAKSRPKCKDCIWLSDEKGRFRKCECSYIHHARMGYLRNPSSLACQKGFKGKDGSTLPRGKSQKEKLDEAISRSRLETLKEVRKKFEYPHNWQHEASHIRWQMEEYTESIRWLDDQIKELES